MYIYICMYICMHQGTCVKTESLLSQSKHIRVGVVRRVRICYGNNKAKEKIEKRTFVGKHESEWSFARRKGKWKNRKIDLCGHGRRPNRHTSRIGCVCIISCWGYWVRNHIIMMVRPFKEPFRQLCAPR